MIDLFNNYKSAGKIAEALLVGRNIFNRNPANVEIFKEYYNFLCTLAEVLPSFEDRKCFAEQANVALAFFSENVEISDQLVESIVMYRTRLDNIIAVLSREEEDNIIAEQQDAKIYNDECIKKLFKVKSTLNKINSQEELDKVMLDLSVVDSEIKREFIDEEQNKVYNELTKEYAVLISDKVRELDNKKKITYNKQAADSFSNAFKQFCENENKYKNQSQLFDLVSKSLFAYDVSKLLNETLIYYNHVYAYIFSKLDDGGKLALTRFSIECERKLGV